VHFGTDSYNFAGLPSLDMAGRITHSILDGLDMMKLHKNPAATAVLGLVVGAGAIWCLPQQRLSAGTASGTDKFSMVTVPVTGIADTEAVFVLDHATGIMRGGQLNNTTGVFSHQFVHNVGADFEVPAGEQIPSYVVVSGSAQTRGQGAQGAIYIAEKNSGVVAAYGFLQPRGRGSLSPAQMVRLSAFNFREGI
jgi:hypothetical protein